jgi:hypothetical protein
MSKCEVCRKRRPTKGSIVGEFYYKDICDPCYSNLMVMETPSSGQASYNRGRETEEHEADIIQPYNGDGSPSTDFIRLYPDQARTMFSDEDMNRATRS